MGGKGRPFNSQTGYLAGQIAQRKYKGTDVFVRGLITLGRSFRGRKQRFCIACGRLGWFDDEPFIHKKCHLKEAEKPRIAMGREKAAAELNG